RNPLAAGNPAPGRAARLRLCRASAAATVRRAAGNTRREPTAGQLFRFRRQQRQPGTARSRIMKVIAACEVRGRNRSDSQLKAALSEHLDNPPRRTDRLTLLALLAAAPLRAHMQADSGLYLAATWPARQNMFALLESVCAQQKLPKPFEFVNSVSNAAGFHVAQQLGLQGPNLFIGAGPQVWGHLLDLAGNDLERAQIRQGLVMLVEEDLQD